MKTISNNQLIHFHLNSSLLWGLLAKCRRKPTHRQRLLVITPSLLIMKLFYNMHKSKTWVFTTTKTVFSNYSMFFVPCKVISCFNKRVISYFYQGDLKMIQLRSKDELQVKFETSSTRLSYFVIIIFFSFIIIIIIIIIIILFFNLLSLLFLLLLLLLNAMLTKFLILPLKS